MLLVGCLYVAKINLAQTSSSVDKYSQKVEREVLASGFPKGAEGNILELVRYTIPPKTNLPIHFHPGMQIGRIEFGMLTYTVVEGTAQIRRANGKEEALKAGQTTLLYTGDSLIEPSGMVQYGKNETASQVILLSASLFEEEQPKATLVNP
ncbi:MAG: cupin domain-containing protein [Moorea sp. SIO2B7]|nr:cupin domain-containing protein [Moorena sp. SIO2B7]